MGRAHRWIRGKLLSAIYRRPRYRARPAGPAVVMVDRKLRQRIARRKEKVRRLIGEQEANLAVLDSADYPRREDYLRALHLTRGKLHQLKREFLALEAGRLPGPWGEGQPEGRP